MLTEARRHRADDAEVVALTTPPPATAMVRPPQLSPHLPVFTPPASERGDEKSNAFTVRIWKTTT
jgi:hypothetical protein